MQAAIAYESPVYRGNPFETYFPCVRSLPESSACMVYYGVVHTQAFDSDYIERFPLAA